MALRRSSWTATKKSDGPKTIEEVGPLRERRAASHTPSLPCPAMPWHTPALPWHDHHHAYTPPLAETDL